ncbi:hypothetical protein F4780DRAFT_512575 [Xylariomycetidae sp. FL0641]|nr:hypothetical protein F4780DRAFT_512575 [Xylariomycetidae sp. FL0641]
MIEMAPAVVVVPGASSTMPPTPTLSTKSQTLTYYYLLLYIPISRLPELIRQLDQFRQMMVPRTAPFALSPTHMTDSSHPPRSHDQLISCLLPSCIWGIYSIVVRRVGISSSNQKGEPGDLIPDTIPFVSSPSTQSGWSQNKPGSETLYPPPPV